MVLPKSLDTNARSGMGLEQYRSTMKFPLSDTAGMDPSLTLFVMLPLLNTTWDFGNEGKLMMLFMVTS